MVAEPMVPFSAYHQLVLELAALKRDGFSAGLSMPAPVAPPELPKAVIAAMNELGAQGSWRAHLTKQAWDMIAEGLDEGEIAARLLRGEPAEL